MAAMNSSYQEDDSDDSLQLQWEDEILDLAHSEQQGCNASVLPVPPNSPLKSLENAHAILSDDLENPSCPSVQEESDHFTYLEVSIMEPSKHTQMAAFIVPGNLLLSDLADAFDCPCDHIIVNEEKDIGRFFFFENVFYNDTTVDQDLSLSIISQSLDKTFLTRSMQETRLLDLAVQLKYPYLYAHAGGCEHIIYIRNIRRKESDDQSSIKCIYKNPPVLPICDMCELNTPVKLTWNDIYAPKYPCFWCPTCYEEFHFDKDGNAVYDFDSDSIRIEY